MAGVHSLKVLKNFQKLKDFLALLVSHLQFYGSGDQKGLPAVPTSPRRGLRVGIMGPGRSYGLYRIG